MSKNLEKSDAELQNEGLALYNGVAQIIDNAQKRATLFLNNETTLLYWSIGRYINMFLKDNNRTAYGNRIIATLSQQLTEKVGKGYTYTALTRMSKVANAFNDEIIATLSQQLSWSHLIELSTIEDDIKRTFYSRMNILEKWGVRELREKMDKMLYERTAVASQPDEHIMQTIQNIERDILTPELVFKNSYILDFLNLPYSYSENDLEEAIISQIEKFILELGNGFAFIERQKRISVDSIDYHLDLLFYHRKLKRLVALDLKLGKFKPKHKAQMELYLHWLERNEMQPGEEAPIGLLLCSEGNTEHIELLMLNENEIKVAQYLTELPSKQWFADKLQRAKEISKLNVPRNE